MLRESVAMHKFNKLVGVVAAVIAAAFPQAILAAPGQWYLNPAIGYQVFDNQNDDRDLDGVSTVILGVEYQAARRWGLELRYLQSSPDNRFGVAGREADLRQINFDLLGYLGDGRGWEPFLALGIGHADLDSAIDFTEDRGATQLNVGGGARYLFNPRWSFRTDLRGIYSLGVEHADALVSLGISYALGADEISVESRGKRRVEPALAIKDSDSDGIDDRHDRCPATPKGREVDKFGCEIVEDITLEINFPVDSAEISATYASEVERLAEFLQKFSAVELEIEGHTDSTGTPAYNKRLSQARAEALKLALVSTYGIDPARLTPIGYGQERPLAGNDTAEGRRANRRAVVVRVEVEVPDIPNRQE